MLAMPLRRADKITLTLKICIVDFMTSKGQGLGFLKHQEEVSIDMTRVSSGIPLRVNYA
jgi:hypothetical protein